MKKLLCLSTILLMITGCTDARFAKFQALGGEAEIECWSGNTKIYSGTSTGKVSSARSSDGYYFVDRETGKLKEVSGNCIITYEVY